MDFMTEYEKWIETTAKSYKEDDDPNPFAKRPGSRRAQLEDNEQQYQQQLIDQLRKQQLLKIEIPQDPELVANCPTNTDTSSSIVPMERRICTIHDVQKELDSVKTEMCSLQRQSDELISDISVAKDSTFGAINALMDDLRKRFQSNQLSELTP
ncbi:gp093L [Rabbit fibroma virus]|uniref:39kDa core protein OPG130 n=1 Tax=Rabbit fibroma virus (strain Kasza) TaxID=10272 RepID=Q9Q8Y5_RFVKA|nr:virion core protein [Rabbit fibroma virus]AAF18046.1 gp093L [Rabbit fibroma virus]